MWIGLGLLNFILFCCINSIRGFNPIKSVKCKFYECCEPPSVAFNSTKLEEKLTANLHGQPLVKNTILSAIKGHLNLRDPQKALVLSFHGSTGVGKNFVSQFIAESIFQRGTKSKYYKQFISTKDFSHSEKVNEYKEKIQRVIEETVRECQTSLFVFDEMDKIPIGLMDTIKAYIDFNQEVDGVDYRKSIFIFLSNSAAKEISHLTLELDKQNKKRDQFELKIFQRAIQNQVYYNKEKDNRGLWHASIIDQFLIDFYIPFLPLERSHVKKCIEAEIKRNDFKEKQEYLRTNLEKDIDSVADEMVYEPEGYNKFSSSGCKRVPSLVRNLLGERGVFAHEEL